VDECIDEYIGLAKEVFDVDQVLQGVIPVGDDQCRFDYAKLENALKDIVTKKLNYKDATMADAHKTADTCRTFVVAIPGRFADGPPALFRSYECLGGISNKCAIWQAARATTASLSLFKPVTIGSLQLAATYVNAGLSFSNPSELVFDEALRISTTIKRFCLVSIGTGQQTTLTIKPSSDGDKAAGLAVLQRLGFRPSNPDTTNKTNFGRPFGRPSGILALERIADESALLRRSSESVHQRVLRRVTSGPVDLRFPYYRFNVSRDMEDIGLEEWNMVAALVSHTVMYLRTGEEDIKMGVCIEELMKPQIARRK